MTQLYMKYRKRIKWLVLVYCFIMSINCLGQNKLNRNQILDVARTHLQNHNNAPAVDSVKCDSSTTKLTLEIIDNSISQSYMIIFTKKTIEIKVYNIDTILYRSTFEYHESSFEKLKEAVNNYRLKKVEPYNYDLTDENTILRLYCGDKLSTSVECYNKRTNIIGDFKKLISEIKKMIPEWSSIVDLCKKSEALNDSLSLLPNTICTTISLSDKFLSFKSKGGEYKKVKITCNRDWELLAFPKWVIVSRNNYDEIVVESTKNNTSQKRIGEIEVGCLGEVKKITILQK